MLIARETNGGMVVGHMIEICVSFRVERGRGVVVSVRNSLGEEVF